MKTHVLFPLIIWGAISLIGILVFHFKTITTIEYFVIQIWAILCAIFLLLAFKPEKTTIIHIHEETK